MTDVNTIASRYIELWNERTPSRRREMLGQHWAKDAKYVDPLMSSDGHDGVDALIASVRSAFRISGSSLSAGPTASATTSAFPGDWARRAPTARSRAPISRSSAMD